MFNLLLEKFVGMFGFSLKPKPTKVEEACRRLGTPYYKDIVKCPNCNHKFDGNKRRVY